MENIETTSEKIRRILYDIRDEIVYKYDELGTRMKSVKTGIVNLWKWKKIIYQDRWWDHSFFMTIMKFKLQTMEENWSGSNYIGYEYDQIELQKLIKIIDLLEDDDLQEDERSKLYEELYTRLFKITSIHKIDKEFENGELYQVSIGIERFWD